MSCYVAHHLCLASWPSINQSVQIQLFPRLGLKIAIKQDRMQRMVDEIKMGNICNELDFHDLSQSVLIVSAALLVFLH